MKTMDDYDGKIVFKNGVEYNGAIENGNINGKGKITFTNGVIYTGEFRNNKIEGFGKLEYSPTEFYQGTFLNFQKNGKGEYQNQKTGISYTGDWIDDCFHGIGVLVQDNQWQYEGEFQKNSKEGYGVINYLKTNSFFKGQFKNGLKHGKGEMFWANQNHHFIGDWKNDLIAGFGVYTYIDVLDLSRYINNIYIGTMNSSQKEGIGFHIFSDGSLLSGSWENGFKEGDFLYRDSFGHFCLKKFETNHLKSNIKMEVDSGNKYIEDSSLPKIIIFNQNAPIGVLSNLLKTYYSFLKDLYKENVTEIMRGKEAIRKIYCLNLSESIQILKSLRFFDSRVCPFLFEKLVRLSCHNGILLEFNSKQFVEYTEEFVNFMRQKIFKLNLPYDLKTSKSDDIFLSCGQFINSIFMALQIKFPYNDNLECNIRRHFDDFLIPVFQKKIKLVSLIQDQKSILMLYNTAIKQHKEGFLKMYNSLRLKGELVVTNRSLLSVLSKSKVLLLENIQHLSIFLRVTERFNDPYSSLYFLLKSQKNISVLVRNKLYVSHLNNQLSMDEFINSLLLCIHKIIYKRGNHFPKNEVISCFVGLFENNDLCGFIKSRSKLLFKWHEDSTNVKAERADTLSVVNSLENVTNNAVENQIKVQEQLKMQKELIQMKMEDFNTLLIELESKRSFKEKMSVSEFKDSVPEIVQPPKRN